MKNYRIELKWAFIFIVAGLLWMLLERLVGLHDRHIERHATLSLLFVLPAVAIYVLALLDKRKRHYAGYMTYKQGFISGLIITLIVTAFVPLSQYLTSSLISPDYFSNATEYVVAEGMMTHAEAEAYFNFRNYVVQGLIAAPLMGLLTTAIVALFTRKRPSASTTAETVGSHP